MTKFDAILIPGGGLRAGGVLPLWVQARFDLALEKDRGETFLCLSAGTTHRPFPVDEDGFPILECSAGARYLADKGIDPGRVRLESMSLDTIGNAWFSKVLHVDPAGWRRMLIITSEFHMQRTRAIFEWIYSMEAAEYHLEFLASPNDGLKAEAVSARAARETQSLASVEKLRRELRNRRDLHDWMFTRHRAYSTESILRPRTLPDPVIMESY
ncbi:MAG: YdcF family protein [Bryobacteraceae bacterium]|nr:YdcF family protein [Bryobacteraceae bacterium]